MGGISFGKNSITLNPTDEYIPLRASATTFVDSIIRQRGDEDNPILETVIGGDPQGFRVSSSAGQLRAQLGDMDAQHNGCSLTIDDGNQEMLLTGAGLVQTGGVFAPSGKYIKITVQGVAYKITLLS